MHINQLFSRRNSTIYLIVTFALLLGLPYITWRFVFSKQFSLPQEFIDSKHRSAIISTELVNLSGASVGDLDTINSLEKQKKYSEALELVYQEVDQVNTMRQKASELLVILQGMTKNLENVRPESARELGLQAINSEVNIINHLITYNNYLEQILKLLTSKFLYGENVGVQLDEVVQKINIEVNTIAELDAQFNESFRKLEELGK